MSKWVDTKLSPHNTPGDQIAALCDDEAFYVVWDYMFMPLNLLLKDRVEEIMLLIQP